MHVVAVLGHGYGVLEVSGLSVDLDSVDQEALEITEYDDVVLNWQFTVDGELEVDFLLLFVSFLVQDILTHFVI